MASAELAPSQPRGWRFWAIMTSMAVASLLAGLDATAVSTAMPSIIKDLGTSQGYMWIANSYLLTTTAFTPIFGQTANIFGRRAPTLAAIIIFAIGSAIAGPAPSLAALVVGRAVQGIGCAGINTMVEMVVCDLVPLRERGVFMGLIFAIFAISTTIGPLIGGAFASYATWRWIFYLNIPLAGLTLAMVIVSLGALPKGSSVSLKSIKRVDFAGNALLVAAITSILIALTWGGGQYPWSSWRTIVPLVLGLAGLPLFLLFETRVSEPTTPFRLFANRTSLAGFWCAFIHNMLVFWILFVLPIYFQAVLRASAFRSGINILPTAAVCMPFTIVSGGVMTKLGRYRPLLMAGFALFPIAMGLFSRLNETSTTGYWAGIQIIGAAAIGIVTAVTLPTILTPLPESDVAVATATWAFMRGFGTIWGAAIPLAVFNSKADSLVAARLHDNQQARELLANGGAYTLAAGGSVYTALDLDNNPSLRATVKGIYSDSLQLSWQVGLGFALAGFLLTFVAKELSMRTELDTEFGLTADGVVEEGETGKESATVYSPGWCVGGEYPGGSVAASESSVNLKKGHRNRWFILSTEFSINLGFVLGTLVPMILVLIFTENHLRVVWRLSLGLGIIPPLSLFSLRLKLNENQQYKKQKMAKYPYWLIIKFYWLRLFAVLSFWLIYGFLTYSFSIYSSSWLLLIIGDSAPLWVTFGWNTLIYFFYVPGSLIGAYVSDWIGPKYALASGVLAKAVLGFIMTGIYGYLNTPAHVAGFVVFYGIFLAVGEIGPGDNIGLLAARTCATSVRGQYYGIAAAMGKVGAFVGTYVFPYIQADAGSNTTKQGQYPFYVSCSLCVLSGAIALLLLPNVGQDAIEEEDARFNAYLAANGFDTSTIGDTGESEASTVAGIESETGDKAATS